MHTNLHPRVDYKNEINHVREKHSSAHPLFNSRTVQLFFYSSSNIFLKIHFKNQLFNLACLYLQVFSISIKFAR